MTPERTLSIPIAIVLSGALIAAAVYFGLRSRPAPADGSPPATSSAVTPPRVAGAAGVAPSTNAVSAALSKALEAQRPAILKQCWSPSAGEQPVKLFVNVSFNESGQQVIRGVREDRETPRPDLRQCVSDALQPLEIPPPGANVFVEVPFMIP